ncbi:hypothetical protein N0V82_008551 [Gnomoniopsis sp. IMI 355080]|nr:hypothetical protein N0V82_008551 [Gnomoniopsis sp. IMI 355080]
MAAPTALLDLPVELHWKIADECIFHPIVNPKPKIDGRGRHGGRGFAKRYLRCGSLRQLTLVNKYFRELTAPYLWESICIDDRATATIEDKLQNTHKELNCLRHRFEYMKKLTVSLGRAPNPPRPYGGEDFIEMLRTMQDIETMRYVMESEFSTYTILPAVKKHLIKYLRGDIHHYPLYIFKVRQLELSCPWGSHNWDFGHLTWPYFRLERLWLDFNVGAVQISGLAIESLPSLKYVMHRAHPVTYFASGHELDAFTGFTLEHSWRGPYLTQLADCMPHVKHFALCGVLKSPVTDLAPMLSGMISLEQLDITDEQAVTGADIESIRDMWHPTPDVDWAMKHSHLVDTHRNNVDRTKAANIFFNTISSLQRICFVRDQVGDLYHATRDAYSGELEGVEKSETITEAYRFLRYNYNQAIWRCGFPNHLNINLWDRLDGGCEWIRSEDAFWLNPRYHTGDETVIPHQLWWDISEHEHFGTMLPEIAEKLDKWIAKQVTLDRERAEMRKRDAYIRNQQKNLPKGRKELRAK